VGTGCDRDDFSGGELLSALHNRIPWLVGNSIHTRLCHVLAEYLLAEYSRPDQPQPRNHLDNP